MPSLEDVGAYLVLYWVPTRSDGKVGKPLVRISDNPVMPGISYLVLISVSFLLKL